MKKLFIFAFIVLSSIAVFSQTKEKDYKIVPAEKLIQEDSSEHHRLEKNFQLTANLLGIGPSFTSTLGIQGGKFIDRNSLILVELTSGTLSTPETAGSSVKLGSIYDVKSTSIGVHYKHFLGNSFYVRFGGDYRTLKYDYKYSSIGFSDDTRYFEGTSIAGNFQIGNQWQWENFTLGCDWVGLSLPVSNSISNEKVVSSTPDYDQTRLKEDENTFVKNAHLNLLRFYLGASF